MKNKFYGMTLIVWVILAVFGLSLTGCDLLEPKISDNAELNGHYYLRVDKGMPWTEAKAYCESQGGHLVTITSKEEQNLVQSLIKDGKQNQYWLGGQLALGGWVWVTGETWDYTNWGRGQPDTHQGGKGVEGYLQMYRKPNPHAYQDQGLGFWNDITDSNVIIGEEDFFTTSRVGLVIEFDNGKIE
jgi:hypothetical protein